MKIKRPILWLLWKLFQALVVLPLIVLWVTFLCFLEWIGYEGRPEDILYKLIDKGFDSFESWIDRLETKLLG